MGELDKLDIRWAALQRDRAFRKSFHRAGQWIEAFRALVGRSHPEIALSNCNNAYLLMAFRDATTQAEMVRDK